MKDYNDWYESWEERYNDWGSKNLNAPDGVHIMNKNESKALRKLKLETGLSEEEIREHKKYRIILSEAQKEGTVAKRTKKEKILGKLMEKATKELKLAKEHPAVIKRYNHLVAEYKKKYKFGRLGI